MARIVRARTVQAPQSDVWALVSDPHRLPAWWPGVQRVEEASADAWTKVLTSPRGKTVRADYTLLESEPESRLLWRHEVDESPFERILADSITEIALEPVGESSTQVEMTTRMRLRGFARLGSLQVRRAAARQLEEALEGIHSALAGEA